MTGIYASFYGFTELFAAFELRGVDRRLGQATERPAAAPAGGVELEQVIASGTAVTQQSRRRCRSTAVVDQRKFTLHG